MATGTRAALLVAGVTVTLAPMLGGCGEVTLPDLPDRTALPSISIPARPTPSRTATSVESTSTPEPTPTASRPSSATAEPTATVTGSPTQTETPTPTVTGSPTQTESPTATPTPTPTPTPTATPTPTPTRSASPAPVPESGGWPWWAWLLVAVVAAAAAAVVWLLLRPGREWERRFTHAKDQLDWAERELIPRVLECASAEEASATWQAGRARVQATEDELRALARAQTNENRLDRARRLQRLVAALTMTMDTETAVAATADAGSLRASRARVAQARTELRVALDADGRPDQR